jgi:hypothetical protein
MVTFSMPKKVNSDHGSFSMAARRAFRLIAVTAQNMMRETTQHLQVLFCRFYDFFLEVVQPACHTSSGPLSLGAGVPCILPSPGRLVVDAAAAWSSGSSCGCGPLVFPVFLQCYYYSCAYA